MIIIPRHIGYTEYGIRKSNFIFRIDRHYDLNGGGFIKLGREYGMKYIKEFTNKMHFYSNNVLIKSHDHSI